MSSATFPKLIPFCVQEEGTLQIVLPVKCGADRLVDNGGSSLGTGWLFLGAMFLFSSHDLIPSFKNGLV